MCDFCANPSPTDLAECICSHTYCSDCATVNCADDMVFTTCTFCPGCMPLLKSIGIVPAAPPPQPKPAEPPKEFMCPITLEIMGDPVVLADGFSYERQAITEWMSSNRISPMTGTVVEKTIIANTILRTLINDWRATNGV
jgi:hypothetical protein